MHPPEKSKKKALDFTFSVTGHCCAVIIRSLTWRRTAGRARFTNSTPPTPTTAGRSRGCQQGEELARRRCVGLWATCGGVILMVRVEPMHRWQGACHAPGNSNSTVPTAATPSSVGSTATGTTLSCGVLGGGAWLGDSSMGWCSRSIGRDSRPRRW